MSGDTLVHLVDDDAAVRDALTLLCETAGLMSAAYASAEDFLATATREVRGCLVLDLNMPGMNGIELQAELARRGMVLPIVFLTGHGDIPSTVRAIKAGAVNFLTKPVSGAALLEHIQAAVAQDAEQARQHLDTLVLRERLATLSEREREVMTLVCDGHSNKEIGRTLGISHRTVDTHRSRIMHKAGAANVLELCRIVESVALSQKP